MFIVCLLLELQDHPETEIMALPKGIEPPIFRMINPDALPLCYGSVGIL